MARKKKSTTTKKTTTAKKSTGKKTTRRQSRDSSQRMSALDAAAKVLAEATEPLSAKELIERMAAKGYWKPPTGRTPAATLSAAIQREIKVKGNESRFRKTGPGRFALRA